MIEFEAEIQKLVSKEKDESNDDDNQTTTTKKKTKKTMMKSFAYQQAVKKCPQLVSKKEKLMFLRCEVFNADVS